MNFASEECFFDTQPMFVCEQVTLKILDVNTPAMQVLGFSKKQFLKKRILDFGFQVKSDEADMASNSEALENLWEFKAKNKDKIYFQLSAHLINYKGRPAKLVLAHSMPAPAKGKKGANKMLSSQIHLNNFPLAEIEFDSSMNVIRWSKKAEQLFGYTEAEAIGKKNMLEKLVYPSDLETVHKKIHQAFTEREQEFSLINRNVTKCGAVRYFEWYNSLLYDAHGEVVSVYSLIHDVTERVEALNNAKRSMTSYQDLFNSISDAIYLVNDEGMIIEANEGVESTFGYKRAEVVGKHNKVLSAPGKYDEEWVEEVIRRAHEGKTGKYEGWGKKKNGEIIPTEYVVNSGNYFGEKATIVIERDVSDRKKSEEALKQREGLFSKLFNSTPIGIALLNAHREVEMVNDGFEQLFGYRESELRGLELDKLIVPEKRKEEAQRLNESDRVKEVTEKRIRKDGTILDVIIYAVPVIVEKSVVGIYGIYVDITDRKKAEEQVHKSLREKEMLLAEIHHRVKNNLAVITGLLELQSYSAENESAKLILKDSQMRVNSIAMVHEKLYQSEDFSEVDIKQYFEELVAIIHKTMSRAATRVEISLQIKPIKLPITQAIPCGLLLNEILTNSYKHAFTGREKGLITVQLTQSNNQLLLTIKDDGIGLPNTPELNIHTSMGMTLIKTLAKQLEATFSHRSENGAVFEFAFEKREKPEI